MHYIKLLQKLFENTGVAKTGEAVRKERAKGNVTSVRAKDAARKRIERSRQTPRDKKSKQELIKEVIIVRTKSGRVQLIFKDSYNKQLHEKLSKDIVTVDEAQQVTKDPKFEQTRASKLLFGDVKRKEPAPKEQKRQEPKEQKSSKPEKKDVSKQEPEKKAKRLSKEDILKSMSQMDPNQLAQVPMEMRDEYFKMIRKPPTNRDFDNLSYENITVKYNLSPVSSLPYNQQVLNALLFLAKMKAGASEQELQTYTVLSSAAMDFTRAAFLTAKKVLSQLGEQCIQNLVSAVEDGSQSTFDEGSVDMSCGDYKFKMSAGGELSLSSTQFDQSNKSFKGLVGNALAQALANPQLIASDPNLQKIFATGQAVQTKYATTLLPDEVVEMINNNPELAKQFQQLQFKDSLGNPIPSVIDDEGNVNPLLLMSRYTQEYAQASKQLLKGSKYTSKSPFKSFVVGTLLKSYLRGDNIRKPEEAPNHLITMNGVFPMTDDYFDLISKQADIGIKPAKDLINSSNISNYKTSTGDLLSKFRTIVEDKSKTPSIKDLLISIKEIDPIQLMIGNLINNNDFDINVSLIPGMTPKDLNSIEFNYVTIGKKTIKIPVLNNEKIANQVIDESYLIINDALVEALSNNFVLKSLVAVELLTNKEASFLQKNANILMESTSYEGALKTLYELVLERHQNDINKLQTFLEIQEKYVRDYKKEYRNYHGKPKQRKERAARTAARELMIKKGRVKRGDGKDVDHKKPLRSGGSKGINNLRVRDKSENRADNGHKKGEKQDKDWK